MPLWSWLLAVLAAAGPASASAAADLSVTMTADQTTVQPGASGLDLVTFTVTAVNHGPDLAAALVTDALPVALRIPAGMSAVTTRGTYDPSTGIWDIGAIGPGQQATLQIPAQALAAASGCLVNTASITPGAGADDPDPGNDAAAVAVGAPACADLVVTSSRDDRVSVTCLDAIHTIRVTNRGPTAATAASLVVTRYEVTSPAAFNERSCSTGDVLVPGPTTISLGAVAPGETRDYVTGLQDLQRTGPDITVTYDVHATAAQPDPDAADNREANHYTVNRSFGIGNTNGATCIIVTALRGSSLERGIPLLRRFRDRYLLTHPAGRAVAAGYYRVSHAAAGLMLGHEWLRQAARIALTPLVLVFVYPLAFACMAVTVFLGLLCRVPVGCRCSLIDLPATRARK